MILKELQYFITTAEHLSFTTAAGQLFITQSGLSKNISRIEAELGVQLFVRDKQKPIELTPSGRAFLKHARDFLFHCNSLRRIDQLQDDTIRGDLSIGTSLHYGHYGYIYLSSFWQILRNDLRQVNLSICNQSMHELNQKFFQGKIDFLITTGSTVSQHKNICWRKIATRKRQVILSDQHPLANCEKISMNELQDEVFVTINREDTPFAFDMVISLCNCFGFYPRFVKQTDNFDTLYMMVEANKGIAISCVEPDWSVCPHVRAIPIDDSQIPDGTAAKALTNDLLVAWCVDSTNPLVPIFVQKVKEAYPLMLEGQDI